MTGKEFMNALTGGTGNELQKFLNILSKINVKYCVIGGLAVNAYVEPVVSLDLDVVIVAKELEAVIKSAKKFSRLRIQIQTDPVYQDFISRASVKKVMGYKMRVASIEDVLRGKIWAYSDEERRNSKRQKDLADIFRLIEAHPDLKKHLPESIKELI